MNGWDPRDYPPVDWPVPVAMPTTAPLARAAMLDVPEERPYWESPRRARVDTAPSAPLATEVARGVAEILDRDGESARRARVDAALELIDELAAFSGRIGRQVELTLRLDGSGCVALTEIDPPLLREEHCLWLFGSIDELQKLLRGGK
jgi:hypothetical protein